MYTHIWNKYLSVIRILLKRAVNEDQSLQLNASDFEKTGPQKKTGFNFTLKLYKGRVDNLTGLTAPAKELLGVLLQDGQIVKVLEQGEYHLSMTNKYVMGIKLLAGEKEVATAASITEQAE